MSLTTEHELECDILVAGGGPAGVPAALAAARSGARVILVQDRPVLGGNASSEIRMHIVGADQHGARGRNPDVETREGGIIEEIRLETAVRNPQRSAAMLDLVLYDLCRSEPNLTLLLNTAVVGAITQDSLITHAIAERHSTEDRFTIRAKVFIDCTGDGRLGAEAGAIFRQGREGSADFSETYAQPQPDHKTLGSSLLLTARRHDQPMPFVAPAWARVITEADLQHRWVYKPDRNMSLEYGFWWLEWGGQLNTLKDNEAIRDELMSILMGVWNYIKNGPPGTPAGADPHDAAHWAIDWVGFLPGKRESRRFIGQYILREQDLLESRPFEDAIAFGGWKIDIHPPEGIDARGQPPFTPFEVPFVYNIPLRSCVARDVRNLMFAGRNISATHVAFASTRVMATCAAMGQGVGTSAAYAVRNNLLPSDLASSGEAMRAIQRQLLREDVYLVGHRLEDPDDLARTAQISSDSTQEDGPARNIVSGQTRSVHGQNGAPPDRAHPGSHRWKSAPGISPDRPAWIELRWPRPQAVRRLELIFDTGMNRELTLTPSDAHTARQCWGRPQPETVRDYTIDGLIDGQWQPLVRVEGNYQRRRVHDLPAPTSVIALRLHVTATNGLDHARLFEWRVYGRERG